jgi:cholesterol oxidase
MSYRVSRRRFIRNTALFAAGLSTPLLKIPEGRTQDNEFRDAIVIGSGFGGAIAALRLAEAGIDTLVIERGRRWAVTNPRANDTFCTFRNPDQRAGWLRKNSPQSGAGFGDPTDNLVIPTPYAGILEGIDDGTNPKAGRVNLEKIYSKGVLITNGVGVGGGSLIYNAILYQPSQDNFERVFPRGISYNEMASVYYPRALSILGAAPTPSDILNTTYYRASRMLLNLGLSAGYRSFLVPIGVDWNKVRDELAGNRIPSAIVGESWYGLNSGAKNSVDTNYLARAEATKKVQVVTLTLVTSISEVPSGGYRVNCIQLDEGGNQIGQKSYTCRMLFLGAGSMGTSALLVRAKGQGTLPRLNEFVGQGWGGNGDHFTVFGNLPNITNGQGQGGPSGVVIQDFAKDAVTGQPNPNYNGLNPVSLMNLVKWNGNDSIFGLAIGIPTQRGSFTYDPTTDAVTLNWNPNNDGIYDKAMYRMVGRILQQYNAASRQPNAVINSPATAHPLGGAVLGQACDLDGRVLGYNGLYVVDGALIPGSAAACNPALTIAAVAERCMDRILARR